MMNKIRKAILGMVFAWLVLPLNATIIDDYSISLQKIWESPNTSRWQKFKVVLHDMKQPNPFESGEEKRTILFSHASADLTLKERAIRRIYYNQLVGIALAFWCASVATYCGLHLRHWHNEKKIKKLEEKYGEQWRVLHQKREAFYQKWGFYPEVQEPEGPPLLIRAYQTLGLSETASQRDIEKQYRILMLKYHPDKHPSEKAIQMAVQINMARDLIFLKKIGLDLHCF